MGSSVVDENLLRFYSAVLKFRTLASKPDPEGQRVRATAMSILEAFIVPTSKQAISISPPIRKGLLVVHTKLDAFYRGHAYRSRPPRLVADLFERAAKEVRAQVRQKIGDKFQQNYDRSERFRRLSQQVSPHTLSELLGEEGHVKSNIILTEGGGGGDVDNHINHDDNINKEVSSSSFSSSSPPPSSSSSLMPDSSKYLEAEMLLIRSQHMLTGAFTPDSQSSRMSSTIRFEVPKPPSSEAEKKAQVDEALTQWLGNTGTTTLRKVMKMANNAQGAKSVSHMRDLARIEMRVQEWAGSYAKIDQQVTEWSSKEGVTSTASKREK